MKRMLGLVSTNYTVGYFGLLTEERPIASVPFAGRYRFVDFPLSNLVNSGIDTVGLITPHLYRSLLDHVGNGKTWDLSRKVGGMFILPGSTYGMRNAKGKFLIRDIMGNKEFLLRSSRECVVVTASNKVFKIDYRDVVRAHDESGASVTLIYKKIADGSQVNDVNVVCDESGRVTAIEQPGPGEMNQFMDALIIDRELLVNIVDWYSQLNYMDLMEAISDNLSKLNVHAYAFDGYLASVDDAATYMKYSLELLNPEILTELFASERRIVTKVQDAYPAKYGPNAEVKNSLIATGCIVNGRVENSVIFRGSVISEGTVVRNSVVMPNCRLAADVEVENVICDKYVRLAEGAHLRGALNKPLIITRKQYS